MKTEKETVSFRLAPDLVKRLDDEAGKRPASRGDAARRIVVDFLTDAKREALLAEIQELRNEVMRQREDFATAMVALLTREGPVPAEEAMAWVRKTLLR